MENTEQIRPLTGVPDHGFGLLGRLAHSVLTEYSGISLSAPRLHLGQNTLPNPPFPVATHVPFGDLTLGWRECGEDLVSFLEAGARALRNQQTPDISAFNRYACLLQRILRFDSIAMVLGGRMARSGGTAAAWPLTADPPGRRPSGPASGDCFTAGPAVLAVAVDRAGNAVVGWIPTAGTQADIRVDGSAVTMQDRIVALLREVLLAQYAWTSAVFGIVP